MEPIRILHIVPVLDRGSGVMSVIMNYYRNINRANIQFDFFVFKPSNKDTYRDEIVSLGGAVIVAKTHFLIDILSIRKQFGKSLEKRSYKIIHCHAPQIGAFFFPIARKKGVKHIILHSHNSKASQEKLKAIINKFLINSSIRLSTKYFACSRNAAQWMFKRDKDQLNDIYILNNAVDTTKFKFSASTRVEYRKDLNIKDKKVICAVGRLCIQKNPLFIIEVFNSYRKLYPDSILVLVGDGPLREQVKLKISACNLTDKILMLGIRQDINNILSMSDLLIMPSLFEGLPVVGVEAQSNGIPCLFSSSITTDVKINQNVAFMDLREKQSRWCNIIDSLIAMGHNQDSNALNKSGFDIFYESKRLEIYYNQLFNSL